MQTMNILFLGCLPDPIKAGQLRQFFVMSFQLLPIVCSLAPPLTNSRVIVNTLPTVVLHRTEQYELPAYIEVQHSTCVCYRYMFMVGHTLAPMTSSKTSTQGSYTYK